MKRILIALAIIAGSLAPAYGAGTIPFSLSQQFDQYGKPLSGCKFYTIQAGTTSTPQNAYQDSALTIALPNPQICDAAGRLPQFFLADGTIKVRLTDKNGVTQIVADGVQVIGASTGSGGGSTVDATTILQTGDLKYRYGTGTLAGFVRLNGRTIGSATSGATERANADAQALFEYLWSADPNLAVSGGRGGSANADWVANKTLTLPDGRARALIGLADMGATASTLFDPANFTSGGPSVLGATVGAAVRTILQTNLPSLSLPLTASVSLTSNETGIPLNAVSYGALNGQGSLFGIIGPSSGASALTIGAVHSSGSVTGTAALGGSGTSLQTSSPFIFVTTYMKL